MADQELPGAGNLNRRGLLKCMAWAGTGVLWTVSGGVPRSLGLLGEAAAAETKRFGAVHRAVAALSSELEAECRRVDRAERAGAA